jgi:SpoVK/Ycf46/Vps4 family AAA+-type ATPase
MMAREKGKFKLIKKTPFTEISDDTTLEESDLCFQDDTHIFQFKFEEPEDNKKEIIEPGIFSLQERSGRVFTKKTEVRDRTLLGSIVNTKSITDEADTFFDNLDVYEELGEPKSRKILLYSDPGMGKTATITQYCQTAIKNDPGTVVLIWPTSEIESCDVSDFLSKNSIYDDKCTRLILVMEDIGGGEREGNQGARAVDSAMLDLLDGIQVTFKLPTLIIATTNYPQNLLSALADRPGRFDLIMQLKPPSYEEQIELVKFISKRELSDEDKNAFKSKGADTFSIAHLKEIVIRSRLHKKSLSEAVKEMIKHRERFTKGFEERGDVGFGR